MINEFNFDDYLDPEHPWVRGLFADGRGPIRSKLDDASSQKLATLTGWKSRDEDGHRYHNAVVMMNITPQDDMYYYMYDFVKGWGDKLNTIKSIRAPFEKEMRCEEHFHLWSQLRRHEKALDVDDMVSIAILTELSKQGRRDNARALKRKGKALLEEEAYSTAKALSERSGETQDARESAKKISQKRMDRQQTPAKTSPLTKTTSSPAVRATRDSALRSSPMNLDTPTSSSKTTSSPAAKATRDSALRCSPMSLDTPTSSGTKGWTLTPSKRSGGKARDRSHATESTSVMSPRTKQNLQTPQVENDSESEDFEEWLARSRKTPAYAEEVARMERRVAFHKEFLGTKASPLAHKGKSKEVSAVREGTGCRAASEVIINQEDIPTDSGDSSRDGEERRRKGRSDQRGYGKGRAISPTKRPKDSPPGVPASPTKKLRVASKMTKQEVSPLDHHDPHGPITISDSESSDHHDSDGEPEIIETQAVSSDIEERQVDKSIPTQGNDDGGCRVTPPEI